MGEFAKIKFTAAVFSALIISSCTTRGCSSKKDIPPEEQLHTYIVRAVNITKPEERDSLIALTTGPLKASLVHLSEESFKKAYIEKKYQFNAFEILERRDINPKELEIDFRLVYRSWGMGENPKRSPEIDTTNRAHMIYEYGQWNLAKVESQHSDFVWEVGIPLDDVRAEELKEGEEPKEIQSSREQYESPELPPNQEVK